MIKVNETFDAERINEATDEYPHGSYKDCSQPSKKDGTPLKNSTANDTLGFYEKLVKDAEIEISGTPDTALKSDIYDAMIKVMIGIHYPVGSTKEFYSKSDPDPNNLPGYSYYKWKRVSNGLTYITDDLSKMSTKGGSQEPVGGETNGTILSMDQLPKDVFTIIASVIGQGGTAFGGSGGSETIDNRNIEIDFKGGNKPHSHELDLKTTYYSKWVRIE